MVHIWNIRTAHFYDDIYDDISSSFLKSSQSGRFFCDISFGEIGV